MKQMENFLPELNFLGVTKHAGKGGCNDVSLSLVKTSGNEKISFVFRNETADIIAPDCSKIAIAPCKNRIFFKEDASNGYKASNIAGTTNSTKYMRSGYADELKGFIGDYPLKFDNYYELYYIEKEVV